jgi:RNA polymerase sigma-70 factor (ECF subfamily)
MVLMARGGDAGAFSALVERHWQRWVGFARSVAANRDAEDVVQDSLLIAWDKLKALRAPEAFHAWLLQIIYRSALRRGKWLSRFVSLSFAKEAVDERLPYNTETAELEVILRMLPPRQRAVIYLTSMEGMSDSEIGDALAIDASSVRSHRRRARETLQRALGYKGVNS